MKMLTNLNKSLSVSKWSLVPEKSIIGVQCVILVKVIGDAKKRCYSKARKVNYAQCYRTLEIPNDSDQETVRLAFVNLCKKYHPDSGKPSADAVKFQEIESAYRELQNKFANERWNVNEGIGEYGLYYKEKKSKNSESEPEPEVFDIKHTAPQHRQYLSFEGIGSGTPSQRQKQYEKYRTVVALENVFNHQVKKITEGDPNVQHTLVTKDKQEAKKIKTKYGIERLVEDLIQESMTKGHFDNLKNQGKPLPPSNYNPYVDFVTQKMNEVMIDNGFVPEWISLQKEIADDIHLIREILSTERRRLGPLPLNHFEEKIWREKVKNMEEKVKALNQKINKFNLVVPILDKQKLYYNLEKDSCDILETGCCSKQHLMEGEKKEIRPRETSDKDVLGMFFSIFK